MPYAPAPRRVLAAALVFFGAAFFTSGLRGQSVSIRDLNLPVYSQDGILEQRVRARSAEGPLDRITMREGRIDFFTAQGKLLTPGSTLEFTDATYEQGTQTIEGEGTLKFASATGALSGVGFRYETQTGRLKLRSQVSGRFDGVPITGDQADALIRENADRQAWTLAEATVTGHVTATDIKTEKVRVDRAETGRATYTERDGLLIIATPVTTWLDGKKGEIDGDALRVRLGAPMAGETPAPAAPQAAAERP